jgi:thioredoxin 1
VSKLTPNLALREVVADRAQQAYATLNRFLEDMMDGKYEDPGPTRAEVDAWTGLAVVEFGADWCGYCQGAQPAITTALSEVNGLRYVKVADGKGKPLGRSFAVKLWPTLVLLKDGQEVARVVRPTSAEEVRQGLAALTSA